MIFLTEDKKGGKKGEGGKKGSIPSFMKDREVLRRHGRGITCNQRGGRICPYAAPRKKREKKKGKLPLS